MCVLVPVVTFLLEVSLVVECGKGRYLALDIIVTETVIDRKDSDMSALSLRICLSLLPVPPVTRNTIFISTNPSTSVQQGTMASYLPKFVLASSESAKVLVKSS